MTNGVQVVGAVAVLFVFVFILGYRLSRSGKPYSGAILTVLSTIITLFLLS